MSEDEQQDEYDVAVVVFCRARGADESDAESGAQMAVRHALAGGKRPSVPEPIFLPQPFLDRGFTAPVLVAGVTPLRYVGGQGIRLKATAEPYQNAGMGKPHKAEEHRPGHIEPVVEYAVQFKAGGLTWTDQRWERANDQGEPLTEEEARAELERERATVVPEHRSLLRLARREIRTEVVTE